MQAKQKSNEKKALEDAAKAEKEKDQPVKAAPKAKKEIKPRSKKES